MRWIVELFGLLLELYAVYAGLISLLTLIPVKKYSRHAPEKRFAVLIAARDEEKVIGSTVRQLLRQDYPGSLYDVYVIPNNCKDDTAGEAERAGAKVLDCDIPVRDKGQALTFGFKALGDYDAYCVFDADNLVDPAFLSRMNDALCAGARVAKGAQRASNPGESWIAGCYDLYFENFNLLYSRPRSRLKLSAKLMGTGFAVSRGLLEEMGGFHTVTLTEDTEFAVQCGIHGEKVWWVPEAVTYDEQPNAFSVTVQQRRRWSSGVVQTGRKYTGKLIRRMGKTPWLCFDLLMMLLGPVTQTVALVPAAMLVWSALAAGDWTALLGAAASYWVGMTLMALGLCVFGRRNLKEMWSAVLLYPLFLASWYPISVWSVIKPAKVWKTIAHGHKQRTQAAEKQMVCLK